MINISISGRTLDTPFADLKILQTWFGLLIWIQYRDIKPGFNPLAYAECVK